VVSYFDNKVTRREVITKGAAGLGVIGGISLLGGYGSSSSASPARTGAAPKRGGTLRVGLTSGGTTSVVDPDTGTLAEGDFARFYALYDRLVVRDAAFELKPHLAEEVTPNRAGDVWTVRLRQGVEFHDGKPLTADDLIYSLRRHAAPKSVNADLLTQVDVAALRKLDKLTVRIPLKQPSGVLEDAFAQPAGFVLPEGYDPRRPVGTGPFRYVSFSPGQEATFTRFESYWYGPPLVDALNLIEYADPSGRVNALLAGQLDVAVDFPPTQVPTLTGKQSTTVLREAANTAVVFTMNVAVPPWNDVRVRQAMRLIVDRPQLVNTALDGYGKLGNDIAAPLDPAYIGNRLPQRTQDLERAKALLKQAGHEHLSFQLTTAEALAGVNAASTAFAQQALGAGVTANLDVVPVSVVFGPKYGTWPFAVDYAWGDYYWATKVLLAPDAPTPDCGWRDREWDQLYAEAFKEVDPARRNQLFGEMQRIDYDRGPWIVWGIPDWISGISRKTAGYRAGKWALPLGDFGWSSIGFV